MCPMAATGSFRFLIHMIYVFDGSFDGLLTVAFVSAQSKEPLDEVSDSCAQGSFLGMTQVITDAFKAERVRQFVLNKLGEDFLDMLRYAFLSAYPERFTCMVRTLHLARRYGPQVLNVVDDAVLAFLRCYRAAANEAHRFTGLTRFSELPDGLLVAIIAPKNNVLAPVLAHFVQRYPGQRLAIYDEGRCLLGRYEQGGVLVEEVDIPPPQATPDEQQYRTLWRTFFTAVTIEERLNPSLQRQHMPLYTWRNLTEMQEKPASKTASNQHAPLQDEAQHAIISI